VSATKVGYIKWFRGDGTGYIVEDGNPDESIFLDRSAIKGNLKNKNQEVELKKGQKVKFRSKNILGREVAIDVEPI
jgi:cold shock CspA family protein